MKNIILFELKKFFKKKKNIIIAVIYSIFILCFFSYIGIVNSIYPYDYIQIETERYESSKSSYSMLKEQLNSFTNKKHPNYIQVSVEEVEKLKSEIDIYSKMNQLYEEVIESYENNEVTNLIIKQLEILNLQKEFKLINANTFIPSYESEIVKYEKLLEIGVMPINTISDMSGLNFIRENLYGMTFIITIALILLIGDSFASEEKNKTYKLLITLPISKNKIFTGKVIGNIIGGLSITLVPILISFIVISCINGIGSWSYPVEIFNNGVIRIVSTIKILIISLVIICLLAIFITILISLISVLVKSQALTTVIPLGLFLIMSNMVNSEGQASKVINFNTFLLADTFKLINDYDYVTMGSSIESMIIITAIYSALLFGIAIYYFNRKKKYC